MLVAAASDHVRGVFGMQVLSRTGIAHGLIGSIRFSAWKPAAACGTWSFYLTPLILLFFFVAAATLSFPSPPSSRSKTLHRHRQQGSQHSRLQSKNRQQAITHAQQQH
jgi:hypothetical protein